MNNFQPNLDQLRGRFLAFDGPDGAGKSTQRDLLAKQLEAHGIPHICCRDPGGTAIGERIRSVLLDYDLRGMDARCEALLFMASRAQLVAEVIAPALSEGKTVLCDRFVSSTCAYQGAAGFDPHRTIDLARLAIGDRWPDLTLIFDIDVAEGFERIGRKAHHAGKNRARSEPAPSLFGGSGPDAMEARSIEYHRRVRQLFLDLPAFFPSPVAIVDARGGPQTVHQRVMEYLSRAFG